jgi:CRP-like cAMP-binding protein
LSPLRKQTRHFNVGSHRERVQNEVLSSGRHRTQTAGKVLREESAGGFDRADNIGGHPSFPWPTYSDDSADFSRFDPAFLQQWRYCFFVGGPWRRALRHGHGQDSHQYQFAQRQRDVSKHYGAGDTFGEIALLDGRRRTATASTTEPSEPIIITRDHFLELLKREPELVSHVVQLLCERIRSTSGLARESALLSVPERLPRRLSSLGQLHGHEAPNEVELSISHEEVARFLGLTRQVVNQYLQNWKMQGWLTLGRGKIVIVDQPALRDFVAPHSALDDRFTPRATPCF